MALFESMLKNDESLFLNPEVLDFDYQPKLVPFRESQQAFIASCIKPLFQKRNGKNIFIFGSSGVGKTVSCRNVLKELEDQTEEIIPVYINVWKANTAHKIILEICSQLNYKFTQDRSTEELIKIITGMLNKKSLVIELDEIDKLKKDEQSILYHLLEDVYRKVIILITNNKDWLSTLDSRIRSRLLPEMMEFRPYTKEQIFEILKQRARYAFVENTFPDALIRKISEKTCDLQDVRAGLYLMKESAEIAESKSSKKVAEEYLGKAIEKLQEFKRIPPNNLDPDANILLEIIKSHSGSSTKDVHNFYNHSQKEVSYKTMKRKLDSLKKAGLIDIKEEFLGVAGRISRVYYTPSKTLDDF